MYLLSGPTFPFTSLQSDLKLNLPGWVGGVGGWSHNDYITSLSSSGTSLDLPTGTELGKKYYLAFGTETSINKTLGPKIPFFKNGFTK